MLERLRFWDRPANANTLPAALEPPAPDSPVQHFSISPELVERILSAPTVRVARLDLEDPTFQARTQGQMFARRAGQAEPRRQFFEFYANIIGRFPILTAALSANARIAASVPVVLKRRKGSEWEKVGEHPALDILSSANDQEPGCTFLEEMFEGLEYYGNAYIYIDGPKVGDVGGRAIYKATEIHTLDPKGVRVVPSGKNAKPIASYEYNPDFGHAIALERDRILRLRYPNVLDKLYGKSKLLDLGATLVLMDAIQNYHEGFFKRGATAQALIKVPPGMNAEEFEEFTSRLKQQLSGWNNAQGIAAIEGDIEVVLLSVNARDGDFANLSKRLEDNALACIGTPRAVLGLADAGMPYATSREQRRQHYVGTVLPMVSRWVTGLNHWIAPGFGPDLRYEADLSGIDVLQKDRLQEAQADSMATGGRGWVLPNEIRTRDRLGPELPIFGEEDDPELPPAIAPAGDPKTAKGEREPPTEAPGSDPEDRSAPELSEALVLVGVAVKSGASIKEAAQWLEARGFGTTPLEGEGYFLQVPIEVARACTQGFVREHPRGLQFVFGLLPKNAADTFGLTPDAPAIFKLLPAQHSSRSATDLARNRRRSHLHAHAAQERAWLHLARKIFRRMEAGFKAALADALDPLPQGVPLKELTNLAEPPAQLVRRLMQEAEIAETWLDDLTERSLANFAAGSEFARGMIDEEFSYDPKSPAIVAQLRERAAIRFKTVSQTQQEQTHAIVAGAFNRGLTPQQLRDEILDQVRGLHEWQAYRIARTETTPLLSAGILETGQAAGMERKGWMSTFDSFTRPSHAEANGQEVGINEDFRVGEGRGPAPGMISVMGENIQCRCGLEFLL